MEMHPIPQARERIVRIADCGRSVSGSTAEIAGACPLCHQQRPESRCGESDAMCHKQKSAGHSLRLDVCRLDDRPPFLDLGLLISSECLRCLFVARKNLHAYFSNPPAHGRMGQRMYGGGIELADDILWGALRRPKSVPT